MLLLASLGLHVLVLAYTVNQPHPASPGQGDSGSVIALTIRSAGQHAAQPRPPATPAPSRQQRREIAALPAQPPAATAQSGRPATSAPAPASRGTHTVPAAEPGGHALQLTIQQALQPYFDYPLLARRRGWEGTVVVSLHIDADGHISQLRVAGTSRHPVLDRAALASLAQVRHVPAAVAYLGGRHSDILLPIEYRLTDG